MIQFQDIQIFLVQNIQQTYLTQGVKIADKHIEIIIKQMTSKVYIQKSGQTALLPGEIINFHQAEIISHNVQKLHSKRHSLPDT